ncbi:hypothetical protein G9A89_021934 [Geosiphon pyriformis]|nr:hypothetical protein G9A89_021934 [Geosiphon pyriformis]
MPIKLILNSGSARSIVTFQLVNQLGFKVDRTTMSQIITANRSTKLPYGKINTFLFEINGIIIPTKVLVMDTIQYQVLVRNNWLIKANAILDWTTQEFLISYNGHHARIPATCGHFQKPSTNQRPTFKFEENPNRTTDRTNLEEQKKIQIEPAHQTKIQETSPTTIVTVVTKKNTVIQKDMKNETKNYVSLVENHCQKDATGSTCQAKEGCITQLANTQSSSDKLYNTTQAKVRGGTAKKIQHWKESAKVVNEVASYNMFDPVDKFQDYYQQLCLTQQEQEQYFA